MISSPAAAYVYVVDAVVVLLLVIMIMLVMFVVVSTRPLHCLDAYAPCVHSDNPLPPAYAFVFV